MISTRCWTKVLQALSSSSESEAPDPDLDADLELDPDLDLDLSGLAGEEDSKFDYECILSEILEAELTDSDSHLDLMSPISSLS